MGELADLEPKPHEQATYSLKTVLVMLFSRLCLFLFFQVLFFAGFAIAGDAQAWLHSANWWPFTVTFANIACFIALRHLLKKEGGSFREYFVFERRTVGKDIAWMVFFSTLANGIAFAFNYALGSLLFGDFAVTADLFYRPLPLWAAWVAAILFPLTMPLGELTTYLGYVMPRLEAATKNRFLALLMPVLLLSLQHAALPLLFDIRFIAWRAFMFLPLALFMGLVIRWRPRLFPYFLIGHVLMDAMNCFMILNAAVQQ